MIVLLVLRVTVKKFFQEFNLFALLQDNLLIVTLLLKMLLGELTYQTTVLGSHFLHNFRKFVAKWASFTVGAWLRFIEGAGELTYIKYTDTALLQLFHLSLEVDNTLSVLTVFVTKSVYGGILFL